MISSLTKVLAFLIVFGALIAGKARGGASYHVLDLGHRGAAYRLEVVNLDGTHEWRTGR